MFYFVAACRSEIYKPQSYVNKELTQGQTFIIETTDVDFNNTIIIPNTKDLNVRFVQSNNVENESSKFSKNNGIVGTGRNSVKAIIEAKVDTELEAFVTSQPYENQKDVQNFLIFTDPSASLEFAEVSKKLLVMGVFKNPVNFEVTQKKEVTQNQWWSSSSSFTSLYTPFPTLLIAPGKSNIKLNIRSNTKELVRPLYALVKGGCHGTEFKLISDKEFIEAMKPQEKPAVPEEKKPGHHNHDHEHEHHHHRDHENQPTYDYSAESEFFNNITDQYKSSMTNWFEPYLFFDFLFLASILFIISAVIYAIVKLIKTKCGRVNEENDSIPPVAADDQEEPRPAPRRENRPAPRPAPRKAPKPAPRPAPSPYGVPLTQDQQVDVHYPGSVPTDAYQPHPTVFVVPQQYVRYAPAPQQNVRYAPAPQNVRYAPAPQQYVHYAPETDPYQH